MGKKRSTKEFYFARVANGLLRMNQGSMPHILKDSESPRMSGHCVSNGFNEHLFQFHSLAL